MKSANLLVGLGLGLLVGAAVGIYLASNDEQKEEFIDDINSKVNNAKEKIGQAVDAGLEELGKVSEKISQAAQEVVSKVKMQPD